MQSIGSGENSAMSTDGIQTHGDSGEDGTQANGGALGNNEQVNDYTRKVYKAKRFKP